MNEKTEALLKRLDDQHRTFVICLNKPNTSSLYSEASEEIRRLLKVLEERSSR